VDLEELFYCLAQESPTLKGRGLEYKTGKLISRDHEMEMGCSIAGLGALWIEPRLNWYVVAQILILYNH